MSKRKTNKYKGGFETDFHEIWKSTVVKENKNLSQMIFSFVIINARM